MAAILQPRRIDPTPRPALRLVTTDGRRVSDVPMDLGLRPLHAIVAVVALVVAIALSMAVGSGALASLAPAPAAPASAAAGPAAPAASAGSSTVAVQAGDTLWSVARRIQPEGDVRPLVDELLSLNGNGPLQVGQSLNLPG